ncbi:MAG TPA: hypothetical protein VFS08_19835 [Gemmatimonadaceae bacterium]|nr:hypothetical protein [Gemmatimonadaceae bacterium]
MLDDLNKRPNADGQRDAAARTPGQGLPMADREVPIPAATPFEALHRWLDAEGSEAEAARDPEAARFVALWRRMDAEAASRRATRAPRDLTDRIMNALPGAAPLTGRAEMGRAETVRVAATATAAAPRLSIAASAAAEPTTSWWERPMEVSPRTAVLAAAGFTALGFLLNALLRTP